MNLMQMDVISNTDRFFEACQSGNLETLRQCLDNDKFVTNCKIHPHQNSGLHLCITEGHTPLIETLVKAGADCNTLNNAQQSPLTLLLHQNQVKLDLVKLLVHHGAEVSETTLLELKTWDNDLIAFLLQHLPYDSNQNWSGFHYAVYFFSEADIFSSTVDALLLNGHHINRTSVCHHPLAPATGSGSTAFHLLFSNKVPTNCQTLCLQKAEKLFNVGADPNIVNEFGETPFLLACKNNYSANVINSLCKCGSYVNFSDKLHISPLLWSVVNENEDNVAYLVENKCHLDVKVKLKDVITWAPIHIEDSLVPALNVAILMGNATISNLLIRAGANITCLFSEGSTVLHIAVRYHHIDIVKLLCCKTLFDLQNHKGQTALHLVCSKTAHRSCAVQYSHAAVTSDFDLEVAKTLLFNGANVNVCNDNKETALFLACRFNEYDLVQWLIYKKADITVTDSDGCSLLHIAAERDNTKICNVLLSYGINVDQRSRNGWAVVHIAACRENIDLMKSLAEQKCDMNIPVQTPSEVHEYNEWKPVDLAIKVGGLQIVCFLLDQGVDISNSKINLPFIHRVIQSSASSEDKLIVLTKLVAREIALDVRGIYGHTSLHEACIASDIKMCEFLLNCGADVNALDVDDHTPLHLCLLSVSAFAAYDRKATAIHGRAHWRPKYPFLGSRKVSGWDSCVYLEETKFKLINFLLKNGADTDIPDKLGMTPLHVATQQEVPNTVLQILRYECNINVKDKHGRTALHIAMDGFCINESVINHLIMQGADITDSSNGWTFLAFVIAKLPSNSIIFYKLLLRNFNINCNFAAKGTYSSGQHNTYLHLAAVYNPYCIPGLLLQGADVHHQNKDNKTALERLFDECRLYELVPKPGTPGPNFLIERCLMSAGCIPNICENIISKSVDLILYFCEDEESQFKLDFDHGTRLIEIALRSGIKVDPELVDNVEHDICRNIKAFQENPLRLEQKAANLIRTSLYPNAWVSISRLGLPDKLLDFVMFDHNSLLQELSMESDFFAQFLKLRSNETCRTASFKELEEMFSKSS